MSKIKWSEIIEAKRDEIEEKCREAYKDSINTNGSLSGWSFGVEIDETDVWSFGPTSQGSQSMSSFNGESHVVASFGCSSIWDCGFDMAKEFIDCADGKIAYPEDWSEMEGYEKDKWFHANHPEIVSEAIENCIDSLCEDFDPDTAIDEDIAQCKQYEEYDELDRASID
jgi:hypothetical protein